MSANHLTEDEARKLVMSMDPKVLENLLHLQAQKNYTQEHDSEDVGSSVSGYFTQTNSNSLLSPDADSMSMPSPSLRRVSVGTMETKSGLFKKKTSVPSLVLSFNAANKFINNAQNVNKREDDEETVSSAARTQSQSIPRGDKQLLTVDSLMDKLETGSTVSYRSNRSRKTSRASAHSIISEHSLHSMGHTGEVIEKKERFWDFLTMVLSISYGIGILMFSLVCYCSNLIIHKAYKSHITEICNLMLSSIGLVLLAWLTFDIERYLRSIKKMGKGSLLGKNFKLVEGPDGDFHIELPMDSKDKKTIPEYYGFVTGRHAGSFFLKIGAGLFCFGHLIFLGLTFVKTLYMASIEDEYFKKICKNEEQLAHDIIYMLYSLLQLFFVFKYGNVIVNKNKWLARFTFMHCAASSLSFWISTVVQETLDSFVNKYFTSSLTRATDDCGIYGGMYNSTSTTEDPGYFAEKLPDCDFNGPVSDISNNVICVIETRARCNLEIQDTESLFDVTPWFYPFTIEFNILIVAIWYILWSSIGKIDQHKNNLEFFPTSITPQGSIENLHRTAGHKEAQIVFADCSSSNTGLFLGAATMVVVIITSIFVLVREGGCDPDLAIVVGNSLQIIIISILIIATAYAYFVIVKFDVNPHPISFLDDMLLFLCLPSFFLYAFICFGPSIFYEFEPDFFFRNLLILIQVLVQTPMIVDGLRRCSNDPKAQKLMKGRNTITFLIVGNLAVYIMETLLIRSYDYQAKKIEFYGPDVWTVLSHMTLPICIFYRFHSAVALVDIWTSAYKSEHDH